MTSCACAHGPRCKNKVSVFQLHNLTTYNPGHADPACDCKGNDDRCKAWFQDNEQQDYNEHVRQGIEDLGELVHDTINTSTVEAHNRSVDYPDDKVNQGSGQTYSKGHTCTYPGSYPYVTTELVRSEPVLRTWRCIGVKQIIRIIIITCE
ncbi:hypothetical protein D3C76_1265150 [compost metagenome]